MIAMGGAGLAQGFALIGFETWPDASEEQLETLLNELLEHQDNALVFLEPYLARCDCAPLRRAQQESGRVVVIEVPPLHDPEAYQPAVEELVASVLGSRALEDRE